MDLGDRDELCSGVYNHVHCHSTRPSSYPSNVYDVFFLSAVLHVDPPGDCGSSEFEFVLICNRIPNEQPCAISSVPLAIRVLFAADRAPIDIPEVLVSTACVIDFA